MRYNTTLGDLHTDLAYALGDTSVPAATEDDYLTRTRFLQNRAKRIWDKQDYEYLATLATCANTFTLPAKAILDVYDGTNHYNEVSYEEYDENDYVYKNQGDVYTVGGTNSAFTVRYIPSCPSLTTTASTINLPSEVVAKAAVIDVRHAEDPEADLTLEKQQYEDAYNEFIANVNKENPRSFVSISTDLGE